MSNANTAAVRFGNIATRVQKNIDAIKLLRETFAHMPHLEFFGGPNHVRTHLTFQDGMEDIFDDFLTATQNHLESTLDVMNGVVSHHMTPTLTETADDA